MAPKTAAILALAGTAMAFHGKAHEARAAAASSSSLTPAATPMGTAIGGALDPEVTGEVHGVNIVSGPQYLTIQITNRENFDISTVHADNYGCPTIVQGNTAPGTIPASGTTQFVAPTNWAGNIGVNQVGGGRYINGDDSLIEANYNVPYGYSVAVADVDISYVNGFSLPITCYCAGTKVTGCNKNLWALNSCPNDDMVGACINPLRSDLGATSATTFFAPCQGQAYTFPNDHAANSFGTCQNGVISCCVGTNC